MQISDILSASQLHTLNACAATSQREYTHTPSWARDYALQEIAPNTKRGLSNSFWASFDNAFQDSDLVLVVVEKSRIYAKGISRNKTYARHIDSEVKAGKQIYWVDDFKCFQIKRKNLRAIWAYLTGNATRNYEYDEEDVVAEYCAKVEIEREKMFYDAAKCNRYSKIGKRGFNTSFDELRALMRHEAYERELNGIIENAKEIFGVL